ncbi:MAG TPA: MFS transporter [Chloroflexota bacterium]|nr:MFS transporter [Chloroflexota bacterium]
MLLGKRRRAPPSVEDRNVRFLVAQTACSGLVQGGITTFLPVFLARLGAGALTVSALNSGLALATIGMALPAGPMVERQRRLVGWSARYYYAIRVTFVLIALAAFLPSPWAAYVSVALWAASGIPSAIANNAWYGVLAEAVSPRRRPVVNGARWALLGFVSALCVALFGRTLDLLPFPLGYQLVFMVSAVGGAVGIWFYSRIEIPDREPRPPGAAQGWRARLAAIVGPLREGGEFLHYTIGTSVLRLGLNLPIGLYSLFWVNELQASDTWIGLRSTVGNVALTGGYYAWGRLAGRLGHRRTLGFAAGGLALYPALTAASPSVEWLLPAAFIWGLFASGIDMSLFEGLLEVCPTDRRAEFVAVNTFVANAIVFVAPILGASLADLFGIRPVLYLAAALHLAAVASVAYLARGAPRHAVAG